MYGFVCWDLQMRQRISPAPTQWKTKLVKNLPNYSKVSIKRPVHTIDKNYEDIVTSGSLLGIGIDAVKRSLNKEKQLEFEITIKNLKEDAKDEDMESGVSDGESLWGD